MREDIKSMTLPELQGAMVSLGQPAFRAGQIYTWLHRGARSFQEMTNLSKDLRRQLEERYEITVPQVVRKQESRKDGTVKYLWRLSDGNCVETVLMRYHYGNSVCISSEVGCPMGCAFCASTLGGLVRRLRPSEMLDQVLFTQLDSGRGETVCCNTEVAERAVGAGYQPRKIQNSQSEKAVFRISRLQNEGQAKR